MEREKNINRILENLISPDGLSNDQAWNKLEQRIQGENKTTKIVPMWKKLLPAVSIAAALLVVFWIGVGNENSITVFTENTSKEVVLPDGSKVFLNNHSEITYSEATWNDERIVRLKGEAYFEVEKGSSFTVQNDHGNVIVLGTSFNIFSREKFFEVDCFTGKVQVENNTGNVILRPGLATRLSNNELSEAISFSALLPDWKVDKFDFDDISLERVFIEFEKEFDIEIEYNNAEELFLTASFKITTLDNALKTVCASLGLNYEIDGQYVRISS